MNSTTVKVLGFFLSLFILINIGNQLYIFFYSPYKSELALDYTITESVGFEGVYVRNEEVLTYDGGGVLSYVHEDGSKVAKNAPVATVYSNAGDVDNQLKIKRYQDEIALLKQSQDPGTTDVANQESISKLINEQQMQLVKEVEDGTLESVTKTKNKLLQLMNTMQVATGKAENFNERIQFLTDSIASLQSGMEQTPVAITTERSGYFVSKVDGYEGILKLDTIGQLTADTINGITSNETKDVPQNTVGKIIDDYAWKLVGVVDTDEVKAFAPDQKVAVKLASYSHKVTAGIDSITPQQNTDKSIIVLSCDRLTSELTANRTERVEMSVKDYFGIRIPREAVRFNSKGEKGAYVKIGEELNFKLINVLYETDAYAIVEKSTKSGYLQVYDEVITEGKDLYDKKPIR